MHRFESDMDCELRAHIEQYAEDLVKQGVPREEALRRARVVFGSLERVKEECREARGLRWLDEFGRNLRYAGRTMRRSPGFTAAAVLILALCIGANTAVFSVVDAVLLRPLPYPEPDRLASVVTLTRSGATEEVNGSQNGATWETLRDDASYLDVAALGLQSGTSLAVNGRAVYVDRGRVSAGYFRVLGVPPFLGREFSREEDRPGHPAVAVLSHALWRSAFHGDPGVVGRPITLGGEPCTVVGVMPAGFRNLMQTDLWTPLQPSRTGEGGGTNYGVIARIRPGGGWPQAQAHLETLETEALHDFARELPAGVSVRLSLVPAQRNFTGGARRPLLILAGAAGLILLIGCINIAGLLLARGANRTREIATRMALGGGRGPVLRQLLTESLALAIAGGALGALVGYAGSRGLVLLARGNLDIWQPVRMDLRVLGAALGLSLIACVLCGTLPAVLASRLNVRDGLASRGVTARHGFSRRALIVCEVALGLVLLLCAGLLIRTFSYLNGLRPGFDPAHVATASVPLREGRYATVAAVEKLVNNTLERLRRTPGVETAAMGLSLPFERPLNNGFRVLDGPGADGNFHGTNLTYVTPDYFTALRIPLLRGRLLSPADTRDSERVAVVNESFVKKYLRNQEPVGSHIGLGRNAVRIAGVIGDVRQKADFGGYEPPVPAPGAFIPLSQMSDGALATVHIWFTPSWIVRSARPESEAEEEIARAIEAADPMLPVAGFRTMRQIQAEKLAPQRTQAILVGVMAGLALLLTALGIYALIANSVAERTRELGVRMALGATAAHTVAAVARTGVGLALAGMAAGAVLALFAVRLLRHMLWGVEATDATTFAAVSALLLGVAAAASIVPSLRAARLNPADTLRQE